MRVANVVIFILALGVIAQTLRLFARNRSSIRFTVFWITIWLAIGVFGLFPGLIDFAMAATQMGRRMNFLFVVAILLLYGMVFRQYALNDALQRQIGRAAQEIALLRYELTEQGSRRTGSAAPPRPPG